MNARSIDSTTLQVYADLLKLLDRLRLAYVAFAEDHGLTKAQLLALYTMYEAEAGELPMSRLAQCLHCDASNVTGIVDRLVAQGLVSRIECHRDRRVKTLALTAHGHKLITHLKTTLPKKIGLKNLAPQDAATLHTLLTKLTG